MNTKENPAAQSALLSTIHKVEGFDPNAYAIDYTDLNTGETRKRLPVMAQMAWFRLVYPEGKLFPLPFGVQMLLFSSSAQHGKNMCCLQLRTDKYISALSVPCTAFLH